MEAQRGFTFTIMLPVTVGGAESGDCWRGKSFKMLHLWFETESKKKEPRPHQWQRLKGMERKKEQKVRVCVCVTTLADESASHCN